MIHPELIISKINENDRTSLPPRAPGRSLTFVTSEKDVMEGYALVFPLTEGGAPAQFSATKRGWAELKRVNYRKKVNFGHPPKNLGQFWYSHGSTLPNFS